MFITYLPIITLVGLALLIVLCLPLTGVQKLVLELSAGILRLALLALVCAAGYLWLHPGDLPAEVTDTSNTLVNTYPFLQGVVPEPGTPYFGVCVASFLVSMFLPLLAVLDVSRKLAGWRLSRLRALAAAPEVVAAAPSAVVPRVNRRAAAEALAGAGSHQPFRAS